MKLHLSFGCETVGKTEVYYAHSGYGGDIRC